jgi:hypothetical protein
MNTHALSAKISVILQKIKIMDVFGTRSLFQADVERKIVLQGKQY